MRAEKESQLNVKMASPLWVCFCCRVSAVFGGTLIAYLSCYSIHPSFSMAPVRTHLAYCKGWKCRALEIFIKKIMSDMNDKSGKIQSKNSAKLPDYAKEINGKVFLF